jgi:hypothetical protein
MLLTSKGSVRSSGEYEYDDFNKDDDDDDDDWYEPRNYRMKKGVGKRR